ncbi:MAG: hypothetical protein FJ023_04120 [Chloroflexi bacterium]|nr:hypothetical protein [Chloroflexota bacterium]
MGIKYTATGRLSIKILAMLGMCLVLLTSVSAPVFAGVEPTPWQPQVNQLNAVTNNLAEINRHVDKAIIRAGVEPTPWKAQVNQLEAMAQQLSVLNGRVSAVLKVLGVPPDDQRVLDALQEVSDGAQAIVTDIRLGTPPDDNRVREALQEVSDGAQAIVDLVDTFLDGTPIK